MSSCFYRYFDTTLLTDVQGHILALFAAILLKLTFYWLNSTHSRQSRHTHICFLYYVFVQFYIEIVAIYMTQHFTRQTSGNRVGIPNPFPLESRELKLFQSFSRMVGTMKWIIFFSLKNLLSNHSIHFGKHLLWHVSRRTMKQKKSQIHLIFGQKL